MMTFRMMTSAALAAIVAFFSITGSRLTAQTTMPAPVTITEDEVGYILDNGIIKAWISRKSGDLVSMKYKGTEMLGTFMKPDGTPDFDRDPPGNPGRGSTFLTDHMYGFWSHDAVGPRTIARITIDPKTNGGERAEVSVKGFSDGTDMGHGPGAGAAGDFAGDIDIRYTLGRGESGLYTYCEFDHVAEYPDATMGEARFCVKLNSEIFDWMLVNNHHNQMYPMELERDGDDKYNYTTNQWENPAFGWAGYYRNVGFFFVNASVEYLTGPPTKVEFLCHRDTTAPMYAPTILNYWRSSHYGGGSVDVAKGEKWKKVIGPFLLYCNTGPNPQAIFADAQAQQKKEAAKWPYNWVDGVDYPKKNERSTVKGQLILSDPLMPGATMSYVRVGLTAPDYRIPVERAFDINSPLNIHWQVDAKHYSFWVRGTNDGAFEIPAVRAGKYTLHAIADGVLGEYAKTDIVVEPGKTIDLGKLTWTPVRRGKQVWDIGIPNRNGSEFVKGDDFFHPGMGLVYAYLFPDDVNFVIGKSDFRKDWFYLHVPHASEAALTAAANSPPRAPRGAGRGGGAPGAGGPGGLARGRGASTLPGFAGGRGAATQPAGNLAGAPATQPGGLARGGGGRGRGGAPGGAPGGGAGGGRATPYSIVYDMPAAPRGKATLRFGIATANISGVNIELNGESLGRLEQLHNDSAIGRNGISGIWTEREFAFDASKMKAGTNTLKLIVPAGALGSGIIYDYIRLELDESAKPTAMVR